MAGKIKKMIDQLLDDRAGGNEALASAIKARLILRGINVLKFNEFSEDDPAVMHRLREMASNMGVHLKDR